MSPPSPKKKPGCHCVYLCRYRTGVLSQRAEAPCPRWPSPELTGWRGEGALSLRAVPSDLLKSATDLTGWRREGALSLQAVPSDLLRSPTDHTGCLRRFDPTKPCTNINPSFLTATSSGRVSSVVRECLPEQCIAP